MSKEMIVELEFFGGFAFWILFERRRWSRRRWRRTCILLLLFLHEDFTHNIVLRVIK
jgi:hypothetical protein